MKDSIFNIAPKKPANLVITKKKLVIALIFFLAIFCILKTDKIGALNKELLRSKIYIVLATIRDPNDIDSFNKSFTSGPFCGWQIVDETGKISSSENFETTSKAGEVLKQEFKYNEVNQALSICLNKLKDIDASTRKQVLGILLLSAIIIFIIYSTKFVEDEENDKTEIPNS